MVHLGVRALLLVLLVWAGPTMAAFREEGRPAIKVIVLNYDPILRTKGDLRLHEYMRWNDPRWLTEAIVRDLWAVSGGLANYQVVEFIDVDAFPVKRDGFRYDERSFLEMWEDRPRAHQPDTVSYATIFRDFDLERRVREQGIQEIWLWGAPYFGWDEYAMKIPGDRLFFETENPWFYRPYDIPDCGRTVWVMGWNYERGEAEAIHSFGHRCEGILALTVGRGIWDHRKDPDNLWNRFTRQELNFPGGAQVGNVHGGPNAQAGYDYANQTYVLSGADDWLNYPYLTGATRRMNCEEWGGPDYHLNFMKWWLSHLPQKPGQTDGVFNNWWEYIVHYDWAVAQLPPPGGRPRTATVATWGG